MTPPARACFAVKTLPRHCKVEIEMVASVSGQASEALLSASMSLLLPSFVQPTRSPDPLVLAGKSVVSSENAPGALGPYSQAISDGRTLYISGQIGLRPESMEMAGDTIQAQTEQVESSPGRMSGFQLRCSGPLVAAMALTASWLLRR